MKRIIRTAFAASIILLVVAPASAGDALVNVQFDAHANASAATRALSGLFLGMKQRVAIRPNINGPATWNMEIGVHYYLFSGDGRVHRGYDFPKAPGDDIRRFDFDGARRTDPDNSGTYAVEGNQLVIQLGRQGTRITTAFAQDQLVIERVVYKRSR